MGLALFHPGTAPILQSGTTVCDFRITPPLFWFFIGFGLFWTKIVYEVYRDILHRDDQVYQSDLTKELSIMAAITATIGAVLKVKADKGLITEGWWTEYLTPNP